jgi:Asp-tRNA(Asn)/Glu-tRNA(Gln) amidotransferase A subunit family amidase
MDIGRQNRTSRDTPPMTELVKRSAAWMARAVRDRELSAVELLDAHAARIAERNPQINALVLPRLDAAREEAVAADAVEARGPLHGVPFTVKDPIAVAGMRSPNGSKLLADRVADEDAEVVRRMRDSGAILLGKTNVSEFACWWDSVNPLFGATANPHDPTRTAGGSSGGEAAAIATGMSPLGIGSDLGGSIRNPCHFVGLFGLKPGRDTVPFAEHAPLPMSPGIRLMAVSGPMARYVEDLELALDVLAPRTRAAERPARIAVFEEDGLQPVSRDCREAVRRAAAALVDAGYELAEEAPPNAAEVRAAYDTVLVTELTASLPSFVAGREHELSPYIQQMIAEARGFEPSWPDYFAASGRLARYEVEADRWLERHPVALCPPAPEVAPPLRGSWSAEIDGVPTRPGGKLTLATYASALGLPAVCVPVMHSPAGLPVGVQLIGRRGGERTLLALAAELEQALGGWLDPDVGRT